MADGMLLCILIADIPFPLTDLICHSPADVRSVTYEWLTTPSSPPRRHYYWVTFPVSMPHAPSWWASAGPLLKWKMDSSGPAMAILHVAIINYSAAHACLW